MFGRVKLLAAYATITTLAPLLERSELNNLPFLSRVG